MAEADISGYRIETDYDNGRKEYEIEFYVGNVEYDYTIDASNGAVLSYDRDEHRTSSGGNASSGKVTVSEAEAKQTALKQAGLSEDDITGYRSQLEQDDGRWEYEIEFRSGIREYEFTIDAESGKILDYEVDIDD